MRSDSPNGYTFEGEMAHVDLLFRKAVSGQASGIVVRLIVGAIVLGVLIDLLWITLTAML